MGGESHIDKNPAPKYSEIILLEPANEIYFGVVHFGQRNTENKEINDDQENTYDLIGSEARFVDDIYDI